MTPNGSPPGPRIESSPESEAALLGAMLIDREAIDAAVEVRTVAADFTKPAHGHIYAAIAEIYEAGGSVNPITVGNKLRHSGLLAEAGGRDYLGALFDHNPPVDAARQYAEEVKECSRRNRQAGALAEWHAIQNDPTLDSAEILSRLEHLTYDLSGNSDSDVGRLAPMGELFPEYLTYLQSLQDRERRITGTPSGYRDLDELLLGLQPQALIIVGARPAMGKCVTADTLLVDPVTGERSTIEEAVSSKADVQLLSLSEDMKLCVTKPSCFIDDGVKPVFRVRTRLGREVRTTAAHPFLTGSGWKRLEDICVGDRIAAPRHLPVFGHSQLAERDVRLLAYMLGDGNTTTCTPRFTTCSDDVLSEMTTIVEGYGLKMVPQPDGISFRISGPRGGRRPNPITQVLRKHGLWNKEASQKRVPSEVFMLTRSQVALFLNRLFATNGSIWWSKTFGGVSYCSASHGLASDVQHLLLRFGLCATVRSKNVKYRGQRRPAWEVELRDGQSIRRFCAEIGAYGKEADCERVLRNLSLIDNPLGDTLPMEVWDLVIKAKGDRTWADISRAAGRKASHSWHPYERSPQRKTIRDLSRVLGSVELLAWADSDVFWDTVVSITYEGLEQVYDLTVPDLHNFVANDICLHNTAFGLGLAAYAAFSEKKPTLFFSLEMGYLELIQRMLAFEADVNGQVLKGKRKLTEDEQARVNAANKRFMESPLFIYDNPNVTLPTIRSMCRQVKARTGELGLVVIDYIQLIQGASKSENRQQEVSEISRGLKILARELKTPVVALAQLSRNLESRVDKRPMLADLRESGSLEQDADVVMFLYRDVMYNPASEDKHIGEVIVAKHRNGANGTVRLVFLPEQSAFCDTKLPGGEEEAAEGAAQEKGSAVGHHSDGAAGNDVVPALAGHSSLDDTEEPF